MLIDLISSDNFISFNIKLANTIGLHSAIYINEVLNILRKAERKDKLQDGFITLDRNYIAERTTLRVEEQYTIDKKLAKISLLELKIDSPDMVKLNLDTLTAITTEEDASMLTKVHKLTKVTGVSNAATKMSQRQCIIQNLKESIDVTCEELCSAYRDWIDGVYAKPNGFLSKKAISVFQQTIDNYTKGDLDLALKLLEIATVNGYRVAEWAINVFEKEYITQFYRQRSEVNNTLNPITRKQSNIGTEVF